MIMVWNGGQETENIHTMHSALPAFYVLLCARESSLFWVEHLIALVLQVNLATAFNSRIMFRRHGGATRVP